MVSIKIDIQLLGPIEPCAVYDENQSKQWKDWYIGLVYVEIETELLGLIWLSVVCDENQIGQWLELSYRYGLHRKQNWVVVTDQTRYGLWWKLDSTTT